MDAPNKPKLSWEVSKMDPDAHYACKSLKNERRRKKSFADEELGGVLGRLAKDQSRLSSKASVLSPQIDASELNLCELVYPCIH